MASTSATNPDTLVVLKINIDGSNRKFKLPLRDLGASSLPDKLRFLLNIPPSSQAIFERYSDSAAAFVVLDPENTSVYKQLYRAAKAKLKLRIKVTVIDKEPVLPKPATVEDEEPTPVSTIVQESHSLVSVSTPTTPADVTATVMEVPAGESKKTTPLSVGELQGRFEELLINNPRLSTSTASYGRSFTSQLHRDFAAALPTPVPAKTNCCTGTELPVSHGATARDLWFAELSARSNERETAVRNNTGAPLPSAGVFSVYCNNCSNLIPSEHFHCSTCDNGDYDLCQRCVKDGVLCGGEDHWMIKRFLSSGKVINSTTETLAPKAAESKVTLVQPREEEVVGETRTCNSCICEYAEALFVTCTSCDDYDLCLPCHRRAKHGHHPKHAFVPVAETADIDPIAKALLNPGRNAEHNAICDGCDKYIYGVRNKCLDCPDWDFCSSCIINASLIHPRHRFVPIYEPLSENPTSARTYHSQTRHHGIYCDGPLCSQGNSQHYIKGDRYKCAVCHDTDYCAGCEASPSNPHNKTHPLIKFKTAVRNVSVTTLGDRVDGTQLPIMGDRRINSKSIGTTPEQPTNVATRVQTVADLKPTELSKAEPVSKPKPEETPVVKEEAPAVPVKKDLVAHFVRDAIADGTVLPASCVFEQTWYLRNGGSTAWPAGCTVKFVGGDNMCAVDPEHPASVHELVSAAESTTCYAEVAPGQEYGFTVLMRTPARAGNFISYWRLTGPDGNKFGHRLWCDVNVKESTPVKEEPKETVEEVKHEIKSETSQMVFPKLDKESPTASIHEPSAAAPFEGVSEDEFDEFEDEPLDDESEDGFMTDEEYDILDAEEYLSKK